MVKTNQHISSLRKKTFSHFCSLCIFPQLLPPSAPSVIIRQHANNSSCKICSPLNNVKGVVSCPDCQCYAIFPLASEKKQRLTRLLQLEIRDLVRIQGQGGQFFRLGISQVLRSSDSIPYHPLAVLGSWLASPMDSEKSISVILSFTNIVSTQLYTNRCLSYSFSYLLPLYLFLLKFRYLCFLLL